MTRAALVTSFVQTQQWRMAEREISVFPQDLKKKKKKKKKNKAVKPWLSGFVGGTNLNANKRPSGERCEVTESLL